MRTVAHKFVNVICWVSLISFFIVSALIFLSYYEKYKVLQTNSQLAEIRDIAEAKSEETGDWSNGMLEINQDYTGWLTVYGTQVDGPVVLGESNEEYLKTDFYGQPSTAGTMFLDSTTDLQSKGNLIIYGHKMKNDTMFGTLDLFKDPQFFLENGIVKWEDATGKHYYHIFAGFIAPGNADASSFVNIQAWNNKLSVEGTKEMLDTVQQRAFAYREEWTTDDDTYLFLVTCDYSRDNGRLVLVARSM